MCSGRKTFGNRTTLGSGKSGRKSDMKKPCKSEVRSQKSEVRSQTSVNRLRLLVHVIHQHVLAKRVGRREIRLALANVGDTPDEAHQVVIARQHEGIDHDA